MVVIGMLEVATNCILTSKTNSQKERLLTPVSGLPSSSVFRSTWTSYLEKKRRKKGSFQAHVFDPFPAVRKLYDITGRVFPVTSYNNSLPEFQYFVYPHVKQMGYCFWSAKFRSETMRGGGGGGGGGSTDFPAWKGLM